MSRVAVIILQRKYHKGSGNILYSVRVNHQRSQFSKGGRVSRKLNGVLTRNCVHRVWICAHKSIDGNEIAENMRKQAAATKAIRSQ